MVNVLREKVSMMESEQNQYANLEDNEGEVAAGIERNLNAGLVDCLNVCYDGE
jgi:hypothetical protein